MPLPGGPDENLSRQDKFDELDKRLAEALGRLTAVEQERVSSNEPSLRVVRGIVNTTGSGTIITGSSYFAITRNGTGDVTVSFSDAFANVPSVSLTAGETAGALTAKISGGTAPTGSAVRVVVFTTTSGSATDGIFHIIAIGPT